MGSPRLLAGSVAAQGRLDKAYPDRPGFETWHRAATVPAGDETLRKREYPPHLERTAARPRLMSRTQELRSYHGDGHVTRASHHHQRFRQIPRVAAGFVAGR